MLTYTRYENPHKERKKTFVFNYVAVICKGGGRAKQIRACVLAVMINPPELPIHDETRNDAHIANTGVRLY